MPLDPSENSQSMPTWTLVLQEACGRWKEGKGQTVLTFRRLHPRWRNGAKSMFNSRNEVELASVQPSRQQGNLPGLVTKQKTEAPLQGLQELCLLLLLI